MVQRAVFVGASNVTPGTWPEKLSKAEGWVCHNYAVGGTYIDWPERGNSFIMQLEKAISDPNLPNEEVAFVFMAGGGNDCRALRDVWIGAFNWHHKAQAAFPNARIISIPMLWNTGGIHYRLTHVADQMRRAAEAWNHEVIWHAWEWLMGMGEQYMADSTHPSDLGYDIFVDMIRKHLRGETTAVNHPDEWTIPDGLERHSRGIVQRVCIEGIVYLTARIVKPGGRFSLGETILYVPEWAAASHSDLPRPIAGGLSAMDRHAGFYVYPDGRVTIRSSEAGGASEVNIAMTSWPIGM